MRRLAAFAVITSLVGTAGVASAHPPVRWRGALPAAPGTGLTVNHDGEPGIAAAPDGQLWATAFTVADPRGRGQDIWTSRDGGRSWRWVAAPFNTAGGRSIGGNDADVAVATARNSAGHYTVYVASLNVTADESGVLIGDISLAVSTDDGGSWLVDPLAAEVPGDDRPWLTAEGACRVHLTYHAGPTVATVVNTYDLCDPATTATGLSLTPVASSRYVALAEPAATNGRATYVMAGFNKPVLDRGRLVIPGADCPDLTLSDEVNRAAAAEPDCPAGHRAAIYVEVATPGSDAWVLRRVARSARPDDPVWPASAAVDRRGGLYVAWTDDVDSWIAYSDDLGVHWTSPTRLNAAGVTAVYPTLTAFRDGVAAFWYQSNRRGNANDAGVQKTARWSLVGATVSHRATQVGNRMRLDPQVHDGVLCTRGDACTSTDSRDLFDDFGAASVPGTDRVSVVYTSDQPGGHRRDDSVRWVTLQP